VDELTNPLWPPALTPYLASLPALPLTLARQPSGQSTETQTARTVAAMNGMALRDATTLAVVRATQQALHGLPYDARPSEKAARIFWWVKEHVRFRDDPVADELLLAPSLLLAMPQPEGDCDDFSMLTAAMLTAARVPWVFVTVAADHTDPARFSHVYLHAMVED
jgi:transglutaminase-like putative cysteine protease